MERETLLDFVAPCSLVCYTCTGFQEGVVAQCAQALHRHLDGFGELRGRGMEAEARREWDRYFADFRGTLDFLGAASCPGCRKGALQGCCIPGCPVPACAGEQGVDFCGEARIFPVKKPVPSLPRRGKASGRHGSKAAAVSGRLVRRPIS